ncbi:ABC transporter permease [Thermoactinomyces mirandus]|uniref:ABC transporter permease n=1 Tax=Thermoactinomyces mirandus TaxID=2756294 RepID=A0A7W2ARC2_9BACL|nr:ABC transporter permease [Thermoactinomyces mirandus]MBA4601386.1 ABC transporter permease [Thermoactinomyces mirandus]
MLQVMASEFLKIRRKMILFLIFLGPLGVIVLEAINFGVRYDYLTDLYRNDLWKGLMGEVSMLFTPSLMLGLTIITSMIANIEHETDAWKQLFALPVTRTEVFLGKWFLATILLFVFCALLAGGTIVLGTFLNYGPDIPYLYLLKKSFFPYFAAMPFLALQIWLSIAWKNQAIPLTVGIMGTILSMYSFEFPDWLPWKWPYLENSWGEPLYFVWAGLLTGTILLVTALIDFNRKDVK